jgi:hydroxycarboxylate dehydrogenase B
MMKRAANQPIVIAADRLEALVTRIFERLGSSAREAGLVARHLIESNLRGHDSHGIGLIPAYMRNVQAGELVLNQTLTVVLDQGSLVICDGHYGMGQVMAHDAMALGVDRATASGSCIVLLRNSHHVGRIGHWAEQCSRAGVVSMHFVNVVSEPAVAPFGGTRARLGTNPFAVGIPREGGPPIVVDFATSRWAVGKVRVAMNKGEPVPPGTLLDGTGQPTTDPAALFGRPPGAVVTFGEHKGWGLSLACEMLAGALTGGKTQSGPGTRSAIVNSMFSVLVSAEKIGTASHFAAEVEAVARWVQSERRGTGEIGEVGHKERGGSVVRLPGDPERETRERRLQEGIPVDPVTWSELMAVAELADTRDRS